MRLLNINDFQLSKKIISGPCWNWLQLLRLCQRGAMLLQVLAAVRLAERAAVVTFLSEPP